MLSMFPRDLRAQTEDSEKRALGLQEALARALKKNKELAAFDHRLDEQVGRVQQAGLMPNPELSLVVEDAVGSGIYNAFDRAQTTLSLEWVLERNLRRRRLSASQARSTMLISDAEILRLDIAAETALRFLSSLADQSQLTSASNAVVLAEDTVVAVKRRVEAGKAPSLELIRAEAELATARLARGDVAHELSSSYRRLAAQWGETEPAFTRVDGDLLSLPVPQPFVSLTARIEQNPQVARLLSEERIAKASERLAEARRWPSLRPVVGVRHYAATDDVAVVAGLSVSLPLFNRNQGQIATTRAALARTRADAEAARVRVHTALFEVYEELQHHLHRAETLRDEIIPRLAKALEETRRGYEQGRYSYFEWRSVQADLLAARSALVEDSVGAHRRVISLERLTGEGVAKQ
jgi:cobalt-zinc-cadmium efflux system outer membrane protein